MKYAIKIICVLVIFLPVQIYYESKYHERMSFGLGFLVALVAFGVAAGVEAMLKNKKPANNQPDNNSDQNRDSINKDNL